MPKLLLMETNGFKVRMSHINAVNYEIIIRVTKLERFYAFCCCFHHHCSFVIVTMEQYIAVELQVAFTN